MKESQSKVEHAPFFSKFADAAAPTTLPQRINPYRMFVGSMIPNWLQCRREISQGPKLAYARLAQHAGKDGGCFPKQKILAAELGVSERTANDYVRTLLKHGLIERERPGLGKSNRYFFLDHPWIYEGQPESRQSSGQEKRKTSASDQKHPPGQERRKSSVPIYKENQFEENQFKGELEKTVHTHRQDANSLPQSVEEALKIAGELGVEEQFARQEYHTKKSVGWKDGYGNQITSWQDHLQARWPVEQRKRKDRQRTGRAAGNRRAAPPRSCDNATYNQPVNKF